MIQPARYLLDEHLRGVLFDAISAYNAVAGADPIQADQVGDFSDLPLGSLDPAILSWAEREGRILVSCDRSTMAAHFWDHLAQGRHSPGLFLLPNSFAIPEILDDLAL